MSKIEIHEADSFSNMLDKLDHDKFHRGHKRVTNLKSAKALITSHDFVSMQLWKLNRFEHRQKYVVVW